MDQLKAYEPTWRERAASGLQDMLMSRFGMSAYDAMKMAQKVTGGGQGAVAGMGLLDVTPAGLAFGAQEGGLQAGQGAARAAGGDVGGGLLGMGLGALAVAPIAKPGRAAKPVFDLSNLTDTPKVAQAALTRYTPPRGVPDRIERLQNNKRAFNQAGEWMSEGMTTDGLAWYNMDPLRLKFVEKLGEAGGNKAFNQYIDLMAATSAGAKTDANARIASYYYVNGANGQPVPIPPIGSGYGHKAQNLHNRNANEILAGGGLDPIEHPKRFTFAENLKGNWEPVTVDKHNIRAWGMASRDPEWVAKRLEDTQAGAPSWWNEKAYGAWDPKTFSPREFVKSNNIKWDKIPATWFEGAPTKTEYQALEQLNQKLSDAMGVLPAPGQAALWLGAGPVTGLGSPPVSMMSTFEQLLQKRAAARGETPEAVLDQFIRRTRPLMVPVGAVGLGGLLAQDPESQ
jgi:hypothetical protein